MKPLHLICSNGYLLIFPVLIWNVVFAQELPPAYHPKSFNQGIPFWILFGENMFRGILFVLPLFVQVKWGGARARIGLGLYFLGLILYFGSWLLLMPFSNFHGWKESLLGFTAPAYTPLFWFAGIALLLDQSYFRIPYRISYFMVPTCFFAMFHISHAFFVYFREY